jgi:hypothetical protein
MKAHGANVKIKRTQNEMDVGRKEVFEVYEVYEGGVKDFQPLQEVRNFRLPMLVLSPIIKVIMFGSHFFNFPLGGLRGLVSA